MISGAEKIGVSFAVGIEVRGLRYLPLSMLRGVEESVRSTRTSNARQLCQYA